MDENEGNVLIAITILGVACSLLILGLVFAGVGLMRGIKSSRYSVIFLAGLGLLLNISLAIYWLSRFIS